MACSLQHLWRHVLRRSAERVRLLSLRNHFGETEISNSDVAINVNEDILWLNVSVNYVSLVQVLDAQQYL